MSENIEIQDEASSVTAGSMAGDVKGVQLPLGSSSKKKNNPSKPYGELSESALMDLLAQEIEEKIQQRPDGTWEVINPLTGASAGTFSDRDTAREKNRQMGFTGKSAAGVAPSIDVTTGKAQTGTKQKRKTSKPSAGGGQQKLAAGKEYFKKTLKEAGLALVPIEEANMIAYLFEEPKGNNSIWESFLTKLPREHVMADVGLSEAIRAIAVAEARTLARSVFEIKKVLESTGPFIVERLEADQDPVSGDIRMPFTVGIGGIGMAEGAVEGDPLLFAVKLESGKPLILFPEESRNALNNLVTSESKLLRAELMHVQETMLDKIDDVIQAGLQRDAYLDEVRNRLNEMMGGMNFVEAAIMKNLVREKLKGAR